MTKKVETIEDLAAVSGTFAAELGLKNKIKPKSKKSKKSDLSKYIPKSGAEKEKERIERKKKKETKAANKLGYQAKFFNQTSPENWRQTIQDLLDQIAEKYEVRKLDVLDIENVDAQYGENFHDRDWSWSEKFFSKYLLHAEVAKFEHAWYRDQCIGQVSIMVWNLVWKTVRKTWKETGTYPGAEKLSKKLRRSDEATAEYLATTEAELFEGNFK